MEKKKITDSQKHACCIAFCKRNFATEKVLYFNFPLHDPELLKKWLKQIGKSNWKPTKSTIICSKHFLKIDIDSHPNRKIPVLKPTAVPKIFITNGPNKNNMEQIEQKNISNMGQTKALMVTSPGQAIMEKLNKIEPLQVSLANQGNVVSTFLQTSTCFISPVGDSLRKILPKTGNVNGASPYIIVIPKLDRAKVPSAVTKAMIKPRSAFLSNKKALLRISVAKKLNTARSDDESVEKIEIKNEKSNTLVTYSLDPVTGDIKMEKEEIPKSFVEKKKINIKRRHKRKGITDSKSSDDEIAGAIKNDIIQVEAECTSLEKHHAQLSQTHKDLQEQKQKLQDHIAALKNTVKLSIEKKTNDDATKFVVYPKKRKIGIEGIIEEVEEEPSPQLDAKKSKDEIQPMNTSILLTRNNSILGNIANSSPTFQFGVHNVAEKIEFIDINNITSAALKNEKFEFNNCKYLT